MNPEALDAFANESMRPNALEAATNSMKGSGRADTSTSGQENVRLVDERQRPQAHSSVAQTHIPESFNADEVCDASKAFHAFREAERRHPFRSQGGRRISPWRKSRGRWGSRVGREEGGEVDFRR
jgi:hypothetical protein